jgi:Family of unknown function (DUF5670)
MRNLFFLFAFILMILWAVGFLIFNAGNMIHILPVLSVAAVLKGFIKDKELLYLRKNLTWKVQE